MRKFETKAKWIINCTDNSREIQTDEIIQADCSIKIARPESSRSHSRRKFDMLFLLRKLSTRIFEYAKLQSSKIVIK